MSTKYGILPVKFIEDLIVKIQIYEMALDESFGPCRTIEQLKEDDELPDYYFELIAAKENAWTLESSKRNEKKRKNVLKVTRDYSRIAEPDKTIE